MREERDFEELAPWIAIAITLVGGALRVLLLANKGLWMDETFSMWLSSHSVADMLQYVVRIDQHPPLYYLLLHYWQAIQGDTAYNVRLLSALIGTLTIPVIYLIGKRLSGVVMGLVAALLLALSPFNIQYAQETRMFTLLVFNAAIAIYALVRLLTDPHAAMPIGSQFRGYLHALRPSTPLEPDPDESFSYKDESRSQSGWRAVLLRFRKVPIKTIETDLAWVAFILFSAATLYSHNTAVLFPLATNIFVLSLLLFQRLKKSASVPAFQAPSLVNWLIAQLCIFLLWSPWLYPFIQQVRRVYQEFWIPRPTFDTVIQTLRSFLNGVAMSQDTLARVVWFLYVLALCLGLLHYRKRLSQFFFLAALLVIPFLVELIVSLQRPIFLDRTLIWTTIPLFLLLAAGIVQLRFRLLIIVVVGILATNNLFSAGDYFRVVQKEDWKDPAGFVANFVKNDQLILFNSSRAQIPFDYYFKTYEDMYSIQVEKHGVPVDLFDSGVLEPKMTASDVPALLSMLSGHKTVWLVYSHNQSTDPQGLIPQTLASAMQLVYSRDYPGVQVQIYAAP